MKYRAVIFDWDGTLADSTGRIVDAMQLAIPEVGLDPRTDDEIKQIIGLGLKEAIKTLWPNLAGEDDALEAIKRAYSHAFVHQSNVATPFYDNALNLVNMINERERLTAVATGKSRKGLDRIFEQEKVGHYFNASRCADETKSKPDPLMLIELLQQFDLKPHEAVMVGDTTFDIEMAQAIDMDTIGILHGAHRKDQLEALKPTVMVDNLHELEDWLL